MLLLLLLLTASASIAIYFGWRRCFHPTIVVTGVQDEDRGPDGQLFGEITLKIDFYAPPLGTLQLWKFDLIAPKKFLDRNIRLAFTVAKDGPVPCEWTSKQGHDAIRRHGVLAPNEQCSVYVTIRMIVPEKQRKEHRLWYFFEDTKLSILYDVSGKGKKYQIPASRVEYLRDEFLLPRLFANGEYRHVVTNPRWEPKTVGLAAIKELPLKSVADLRQEQYASGHELNVPIGNSWAFFDEWNACYEHYQKEIACREDAN